MNTPVASLPAVWHSADTIPSTLLPVDATRCVVGLALHVPDSVDGGPDIRQGYYDPAFGFMDANTGMQITPRSWSSPALASPAGEGGPVTELTLPELIGEAERIAANMEETGRYLARTVMRELCRRLATTEQPGSAAQGEASGCTCGACPVPAGCKVGHCRYGLDNTPGRPEGANAGTDRIEAICESLDNAHKAVSGDYPPMPTVPELAARMRQRLTTPPPAPAAEQGDGGIDLAGYIDGFKSEVLPKMQQQQRDKAAGARRLTVGECENCSRLEAALASQIEITNTERGYAERAASRPNATQPEARGVEAVDRVVRSGRRFYFQYNPPNTMLAQVFNDILRANGTHEDDREANKSREDAAATPNPVRAEQPTCPKCGATSEDDAGSKCIPDGDSCPGVESPLAEAWAEQRKGAYPEYVIGLLIAGGFVTQAKVDEARAIALGLQPGPLAAAPAAPGAVVGVDEAMVERACKKYAFREDGATFPDDYSENEVIAERVLMREFLQHVISGVKAE